MILLYLDIYTVYTWTSIPVSVPMKAYSKWAASWQNQQNNCASSEDSDQIGHPPSLIRVFAVRMKKVWVLSYLLSAQRRLWSDWADAQADLSLRWAYSHLVGFVMSRLIYYHIAHGGYRSHCSRVTDDWIMYFWGCYEGILDLFISISDSTLSFKISFEAFGIVWIKANFRCHYNCVWNNGIMVRWKKIGKSVYKQ